MVKIFKFQTDLVPGSFFDGTQIDLVSSDHCLADLRFLLENEDEFLVVYGDEFEAVELESEDVLL